MNNTKNHRNDLFTGDDVVVSIGKEYCLGNVASDTKATLTVRFKPSGKALTALVFNRKSGYEKANNDFVWGTPRVYAPMQQVGNAMGVAMKKIVT